MMFRRAILLVVSLLLMAVPTTHLVQPIPAAAQDGDTTCPIFVATALEAVGQACDAVDRNEACYGHNLINATFWADSGLTFGQAADRVSVADLQTLSTAPLDLVNQQWGVAVLRVQANIPDTLPGQAVTLLLMGDASLENAVQPGAAGAPATTVLASTVNTTNLRSAPSTDAPIVDNVPEGTPLTIIGVNDVRNWYEVQLESGSYAWIWSALASGISEVDLYALPVTTGTPSIARYGPMQAFYFDTGLGDASCDETPNALMVQSPEDVTITLRINDLDVRLGSTAIFTMADLTSADGTTRAMVGALIDGELSAFVNGARVQLTQGGGAFAVTVNAEGKVDTNSRVTSPPAGVVESVMQNACQSGSGTGLFPVDITAAACSTALAFYVPPEPTPVPVVAAQPAQPAADQPGDTPAATEEPAAPAAAPAAPVAVSGSIGGSFEVGAHVAGMGPPAPDLLNRAGMRWIKHQVRFSMGADPSEVAWRINEAHGLGLKVLLGVVGHPSELGGTPEDQYFADYARYVGGLAAAGADAIEVWNEMNIDREWPTGRIDPAMYVRLLAAAYNSIKSNNGSTMVISGALAPTGAEGAFGRERVWNDDGYYAGMAAAGAAQYMDCIGAHYNEGIVSPDQVGNDPRGDSYPTRFLTTMTDRAWGPFGGQRPVCYTELGYLTPEGYGPLPAGFEWAGSVTLAQQAAWLANAAVINSNSGKVRLMIVWNLNFSNYEGDPMAGFAMLRPDGSCPACDTMGQVTP